MFLGYVDSDADLEAQLKCGIWVTNEKSVGSVMLHHYNGWTESLPFRE